MATDKSFVGTVTIGAKYPWGTSTFTTISHNNYEGTYYESPEQEVPEPADVDVPDYIRKLIEGNKTNG